MSNAVFHRKELRTAALHLGSISLDLADYATTGLRIVAVGPSGSGKTNAALLCAEQLAAQGWVSIVVSPEGEVDSFYGEPITQPEALEETLRLRDRPVVVVVARTAADFVPFGEAIMEAADRYRKPIFLAIDEAQLFSNSKKRSEGLGDSSDVLNDILGRGRKRALDVFMTAHSFSASLHRTVFSLSNLKLIGTQEDPKAWSTLAPQFRGTNIGYQDLAALAPGEFFCFSRRGVEKVVMAMSDALGKVAPKARKAKPVLPTSFTQWDRAVRAMPTARLRALTPEVVALLGTVSGLSPQQIASGGRALADELASRA
ncbi:MAG TPA: ATP-binding protein [Nevskia sp.]|nr:ATP-binding protein [Nevskia sp.]